MHVHVHSWLPSGDLYQALRADALARDQVDEASALATGRAVLVQEGDVGIFEREAVCFKCQSAPDARG